MNEITYPIDSDCVWMAADRDGHLGAFLTAGTGPIPMAALASVSVPLSEVECTLAGLARTTQARLLVSVGRPDDLIALAERGLFVFDWTESIDAYRPVAEPAVPIRIDALPEDLAALARSVRTTGLAFADGKRVDIGAHLPCSEPE